MRINEYAGPLFAFVLMLFSLVGIGAGYEYFEIKRFGPKKPVVVSMSSCIQVCVNQTLEKFPDSLLASPEDNLISKVDSWCHSLYDPGPCCLLSLSKFGGQPEEQISYINYPYGVCKI